MTLLSHNLPTQQDRPCAEEADTGDDVSGDAGGVEDDVLGAEHVAEAECRSDDDRAGADAHQPVGPQAGRPEQARAQNTDRAAEDCGQDETRDDLRITDHSVSAMG